MFIIHSLVNVVFDLIRFVIFWVVIVMPTLWLGAWLSTKFRPTQKAKSNE